MSKVDPSFLKDVQRSGWHIEKVEPDHVIGKCPSHGCALRAKLAQGAKVPAVDPSQDRDKLDEPIESFDQLRRIMRARREGLGLTMHEVEELAGMSVDFVAKFEKDNPSKLPNMQTTLEWIQSLGYEVVIRKATMPPLTLRTICDTRDKLASRQKRFAMDERRRGQRGAG